MRWLLMLLVLLNLLLYVYQFNQAAPVGHGGASLAVPARGGDIKLLSEAKPLARDGARPARFTIDRRG